MRAGWLRLLCLSLVLLTFAVAAPAPSAGLTPNLRGEVMILVYHHFGNNDARWTRSWSGFNRDLTRLEAEGYRPVTLSQLVSGDFDIPAGTTPVVLTFDDSTANQVKFTPDGKLAPDCALAYWQKFAEAHPDFPMRGVFFVNSGYKDKLIFDQPQFAQQKLKLILSLGGEIGNHTYTHANLRKDAKVAEKEIALGQEALEQLLPGYTIHSFALPFGIYPQPQQIAWQGDWRAKKADDIRWKYDAVVKVGANPASSPLVVGFDPLHLPRVQAIDSELDRWFGYFERHPERRFVSDGQRHTAESLPPLPRNAQLVNTKTSSKHHSRLKHAG